MSFKWYQWANKQKNLSPPEKAVLKAIADYFNDELGYAWPSQEKLAEDTSYNRSTISRACKKLKNRGLLSWKKDMRSSGHFSSNRYELHHVADSHAAENLEAEEVTTVLTKAPSPCRTGQQKHLAEPLDSTLNLQESRKENKELTEGQHKLAETWAKKLIARFPGEYFSLPDLISDIEKFLLSDQSDESWQALGNGHPNPKKLFGRS